MRKLLREETAVLREAGDIDQYDDDHGAFDQER
jgi:hypothetical protein